MSDNTKSPLFFLIAIILGAVAIIGVGNTSSQALDQTASISLERTGRVAGVSQAVATIGVNEGNGKILSYDQPIDDQMTVLDLLQVSMQRNLVTVQTKKYDFGTLVDSIDGVVNGTDGKYWIYEVNGESPTIAADQYIVQPGDIVEFKFTKTE